MLTLWLVLVALAFAAAMLIGLVNPVLSWMVLSALCFIGSGLLGYYSITSEDCGLVERYDVGKNRSECSWGTALFVPGMLMLFQAWQLFRFAGTIVEDNFLLQGLMVMAMLAIVGAAAGVLSYASFNVCKDIARRQLKAQLAPRFGRCYDAQKSPEKAAEACEGCQRVKENRCPLNLGELAAQADPGLQGHMIVITKESLDETDDGLKGYTMTVTKRPLQKKHRPAPAVKKQPMVTVQMDDILEALRKGRDIWASQVADGLPQICSVDVEAIWIPTDQIDREEREKFQQAQEKELQIPYVS